MRPAAADAPSRKTPRVNAVVIGRNEGPRLDRCLASVCPAVEHTVYVDSRSSDASVEVARRHGAHVVELPASQPLSAARARNAGLDALLELAPDTELVQFVDGDCEMDAAWVERAAPLLVADADLVAIVGSLRERHPESSIFNLLCDVEWRQGSYGRTRLFGGNVLVRAHDVKAAGGFRPDVIAAEDHDLAMRMCGDADRVLRIDVPMVIHEAGMTRFSQWWRRAKRSGYGYANVGALHRTTSFSFVAERRRIVLWGVVAPLAIVATVRRWPVLAALVALTYPARFVRVLKATVRRGESPQGSAVWAASCALSPLPQALGMARYYVDRARAVAPALIEYK